MADPGSTSASQRANGSPACADTAIPQNRERGNTTVGEKSKATGAVLGATDAPHAQDNGGVGEEADDTSCVASDVQQEPDPFYDEAADDADEAWMDQQRAGRVSDAVLSCPGCFITLCIDCQRHEKYHHQYRAMFVMNCQVDEINGEAAAGAAGSGFSPAPAEGGGGGTGRGGRRPKRPKPSAEYLRVRCGACGTEVGAYEPGEELYHFYHVFPSNA